MTIGLANNQSNPETTVNQMVQGITNIDAAGTGSTHLTDLEQTWGIITFSGVVTGNRTITMDDTVTNNWVLINNTTDSGGPWTLTVTTVSGTGVVITKGEGRYVYSDGTNIVNIPMPIPGISDTTTSVQVTLTDAATAIGNELIEQTSVGLTAFAGGSQVSATQLVAGINQISTCATGGDSVKLPTAVGGQTVTIVNNGIAACDVFPASADNLPGLAVNLAISLGVNAKVTYHSIDSTSWA